MPQTKNSKSGSNKNTKNAKISTNFFTDLQIVIAVVILKKTITRRHILNGTICKSQRIKRDSL